MVKKLFVVLLILSLTAACSACAKPAESPAAASKPEPDYTPKEMTFEHVSVSIRGMEELQSNGLRVEGDPEDLLKDVTIVASVPLKQTPYVDASVFDPHIDLSSIQSEGAREIEISCKMLDPDYGRIVSITPASITVRVVADNPLQEITFGHAAVSVVGSDLMKNRSLIVTSNLDEQLNDVTVAACVPEKSVPEADVSVYNLRIDLSDIRSAGEYELPVQSSTHDIYGQVVGITPSAVNVTVEEAYTLSGVPVTVRTIGNVPEGWYMATPSSLLGTVSVYGPASLVKEVSRAIVTVDLDALKWEEGSVRQYCEIKLYNQNGEEMISPLLTIQNEGIDIDGGIIELSIMPTRDFSVLDMIQLKGQPAEGYQIDRIKISPAYISIAGSEDKLKELEELPVEYRAAMILDTGTVDITGQTGEIIYELKIKALTPEKDRIKIVKPGSSRVLITVEISPTAHETAGEEPPADTAADGTAPTDEPVPYVDENTVLYYSPEGGRYYHLDQNCPSVNPKYLPLEGQFTYAQLGDEPYVSLKPCSICEAPLR